MKEFQLIRQIQQGTSVCDTGSGVVLGIGDDGAVLEMPAGQNLVAATDTLNAGVHFPMETSPFDIGFKCLAVNLSDLAAMGATPKWALLSLSSPAIDAGWLSAFTDGFKSLAEVHGVSLVGGDTTSGPLSISLTALGMIEAGKQLQRNGAKPGDLVVVSGTLGGAAYGLHLLQAGQDVTDRHLLDRPQPRLSLGQALIGYASSCIDVSDGMLADLGHILDASGCGARIEVDSLPASETLEKLEPELKWRYQLSGGDDYELLFTLPECHRDLITTWSQKLNISLNIIGEIEVKEGVRCVTADGYSYQPDATGFEHFRDNT